MKYMEVQVRDAITPSRNIWQEGKSPSESGAEDYMIDIRDGGSVFEMHSSLAVSARDMGYWGSSLYTRVFECLVAEVDVVFPPDDRIYR